MTCAICRTRRAKRYCPGVRGEICTVCCGEEREKTVRCPFDCEFLIEARKHERLGDLRPSELPYQDIRVTERILSENEQLLYYVGVSLTSTALETPGAVDADVREVLDALIRTYRTLESGLYYESVPQNTIAAQIFRKMQEAIDVFRKSEAKELGVSKTRGSGILATLVYLLRLELDSSNGRPLGRAFLDMMRRTHDVPQASPAPSSSSLILP